MRKYLISVLAAVLLLFSASAPSFAAAADENSKASQVPEAVALVAVDNPDCKLINEIKDLCVKISMKDSGKTIAEIPVVRVEQADDDIMALWLGYEPKEKIVSSVKQEMESFQKDFHLSSWAELKKMLESSDEDELEAYLEKMVKDLETIFSNYTVELTGLPSKEDHQFETEAGAMILTSELTSEFMSLVKNIIGEAFEMTQAELAQINSFSSMLNMIETKLVKLGALEKGQDILSLMEEFTDTKLTAAEKQAFYDEIKQLDDILAYMKSEDYEGTVIAGVYVTCGCPVRTEYEIVHQYFKEVNGKMKLMGTVFSGPMNGYYEGFTGDVIKASDYVKCKYKSETYQYIGSYDWLAMLYDQAEVDKHYNDKSWWENKKADKLVLGDGEDSDSSDGLLLRYEIKEQSHGTSPKTGDDSRMMPYVIIMILSASVMAIAAVFRRKHQ